MPTEKPSDGREVSPGRNGGIKAKLASRFKKRPDDHEKKKQLQDYTAWVNNYLRRKPGTPLVTDLRTNLQDGLTFVNLVEIVAKVELQGIDRWPNSPAARKQNTSKAINFLKKDGVTLHHDAVKDLLEGSSKGIMRVVLAIAERYQPRSVKPRSGSDPKELQQQQSSQHHMTRVGNQVTRDGDHVTQGGYPANRSHSPDQLYRSQSSYQTSLPTSSFSVPNVSVLPRSRSLSQPLDHTPGYLPPQQSYSGLSQPERTYGGYVERSHTEPRQGRSYSLPQTDGENDTYSTPVDQLPPSAAPHIVAPKKKLGVQLRLRSGSTSFKSIPEEPSEEDNVEEVTKEMGAVISGLAEFKTELLQLHAMLLRNSDGAEVSPTREGGGGEQETPARGKPPSVLTLTTSTASTTSTALLKKEEEIASLRDQLSQLQDEHTQMGAECAALRNMVEERNTFITTMKTEIYRKEYKNDTERVDLHGQIHLKETVIKKLESDLASCQELVEAHQQDVEELKDQLEKEVGQEAELQEELAGLRTEVMRLGSAEDTLQSKLSGRDRRIAHLEEKMADMQEARVRRLDAISDDVERIREGLGVLRTVGAAEDPQHQTIDSLERNIAELMGKLMERASSPSGRRGRRHRDSDDHHRERERRKRHKEKHGHSSESRPEPVHQATPTSPGVTTKVFYYMLNDKTETPYVTLVPRKVNEVRLKDFKSVFDRHGNFRFFFKSEDPDCGVVKEEIIDDEQVLPCWNGKILVWVNEKGHHR